MNQGEEKEIKQINRVGRTAAMVPEQICFPSSDLNTFPHLRSTMIHWSGEDKADLHEVAIRVWEIRYHLLKHEDIEGR